MAKNKPNHAKYTSINVKITLMIVLMVLCSSLFVGVFTYLIYRADCLKYKKETALNISEAVSAMLDGDALEALVISGVKDDYFEQTQPMFEQIRDSTDVQYLYVIADNGDGVNYRYIFDADGADRFGSLDPIEGYGAEETFATGASLTEVSYLEEYGNLLSSLVAVYNSKGKLVGVVGTDLPAQDVFENINIFGIKVVIAIVSFNILFIIIAFLYLKRTLGKPIIALTDMGAKLANGDLSAQADIQNKDEIGLLAENFTQVRQTLSNLIACMHQMSDAQSAGDYEAFLDPAGFNGAYNTVALGVNKMVENYSSDLKEVITAVSAYGAGNFTVTARSFPGKKASINVALERMRATFKALHTEIGELVVSAGNGDLSRTIETGNFTGEWGLLTGELNRLLSAINEPIVEAEKVLQKMSEGNFGIRMTGAYNGAFNVIKHSINTTQDALSSYITEISGVLGGISQQNLSTMINRPYIGEFDRIKESINTILDILNSVLSDMRQTADGVADGAKQINATSAELSTGAVEQSSVVEELNAAIETVYAQTEGNAQASAQTMQLVSEVKSGVRGEETLMREMLAAMSDINKSSANVLSIVKVTEDIAMQTNLLALNASVEAARAGVHGKGFAVVAEEVGNLASRSKKAAEETADLIEGSVRKASEGMQVAEKTAKNLEQIVEQINRMAEFIQRITESTANQRTHISQINQGISQVAQVAQTNTDISRENATFAEDLSARADQLRDAVAGFRLR